MKFFEILKFALRGLGANKMRSGLTTLGILIGVASVIVLLAVGNGSSQAVRDSISSLGAGSLTVSSSTTGRGGGGGGGFPGMGGGQSTSSGPRTQAKDLTIDDANALVDPQKAPNVESSSPVVNASSVTTTYGTTSHDISQFIGTYPGYFKASNKNLAKGGLFTKEQVDSRAKVVIIGQTVAEELFGTVEPVGAKVSVDGTAFTVVGVLKEAGSSSTSFQDADDVAIAPITAVQGNLTSYGELSQIVVQAKSADVVDAAQEEITEILNERHEITDTADFTVYNQASAQDAASESNETFTVLLGAVAAISLLVGGIGVTNIMLVTVTERTREIGIRKAIGAPKGAILGQFVAEATILSVLGGVLGVVVGVVGSQFEIVGVQPVIMPWSIGLALGVSVVIGLFFGSYPANRAANLRPIEALRHE
ncbi:ABC transporter permease [Actinocorallia aurea]